jgi:hypothetical protein
MAALPLADDDEAAPCEAHVESTSETMTAESDPIKNLRIIHTPFKETILHQVV